MKPGTLDQLERDVKRRNLLASRVAFLMVNGQPARTAWEVLPGKRVACWVLRDEGISHAACANDLRWPRSEPQVLANPTMRRCAGCLRRSPHAALIEQRVVEMMVRKHVLGAR